MADVKPYVNPKSWLGKAADAVDQLVYPRPEKPDVMTPPTEPWWPGTNPIDRTIIAMGDTFDKTTIAGFLSQAQNGELWRFSAFKYEMRASDAHLDGEIRKVESYLTQAPFEINPPARFAKSSMSNTPEAKQAAEIADYVREQLLDPDIDIRAVVRHFLWGLMDGVAGVQVLVDPGAADKGREKLVSLTPIASLRFNYIPATTILAVTPGDVPMERVPISQYGAGIAVIIADPNVPSPARRGVLRRCLTPWIAHRYGIEWWGKAVELFGIPFRKGKYPASNERLRAALIAAMQNQGAASYGAFPEGTDIEVIANGISASGSHKDWLEFMESAMSKAILGSTQTTQIQANAGSLASATVHQDVAEIFCEAYGVEICNALREQIIRPLVARNFGEEEADSLCPIPSINIKGYEDLSTFSTSLQTLVAIGLPIPQSWVYERSGVPKPAEDDEILSGQSASQAQAAELAQANIISGEANAQEKAAADQKRADQQGAIDHQRNIETLKVKGGAPPNPKGKVLPFGKKKNMTAAEFRAAVNPKRVDDIIAALEARNDERAAGSGEEIVAEYTALIEEVKRDGGDLGHLAARVRMLAKKQDRSVAETAALIEAVLSDAMLSGLSSADEA